MFIKAQPLLKKWVELPRCNGAKPYKGYLSGIDVISFTLSDENDKETHFFTASWVEVSDIYLQNDPVVYECDDGLPTDALNKS